MKDCICILEPISFEGLGLISTGLDQYVVEKNNVTFWPLAVYMEYCNLQIS